MRLILILTLLLPFLFVSEGFSENIVKQRTLAGATQGLPDLVVITATDTTPGNKIQFTVKNKGQTVSPANGQVWVTSPLSTQKQQFPIPALQPGESKIFTTDIAIDAKNKRTDRNYAGTAVTLTVNCPCDETNRDNNTYTFTIGSSLPAAGTSATGNTQSVAKPTTAPKQTNTGATY
ncbi:MAG TPA: CARDB domain-containing protein [Bdellovibrionota bacterium]|nr:CARDB domain-containing protein [Bdellovibrionota bacterium]